jgi:hypothetical protein
LTAGPARQGPPPKGGVDPAWGYAGVAGLALVAMAAILLAPFATPPSPDRVAGVLFGFGLTSAQTLPRVLAADPGARVVDVRWGGRLVFVSYRDPAFPATVAGLGAWRSFDAVAAGCHAAGALEAAASGAGKD